MLLWLTLKLLTKKSIHYFLIDYDEVFLWYNGR